MSFIFSLIFVVIAVCCVSFLVYRIAYFFTGSAFFAVLAVACAFCILLTLQQKGKSFRDRQNEAYAKEKSGGMFTFKAEPYRRTSAPLVLKIGADGKLSEVSPSKKERTYTLTHTVYFGNGTEPCGFQITVLDKDGGKSEEWLLHRKKSYFHTDTEKVRLAPCDDFNEVKNFFENLGKDAVSYFSHESWMNANPLCLHTME